MSYLLDLSAIAIDDQQWLQESLEKTEITVEETRQEIEVLEKKRERARLKHEKHLAAMAHWQVLLTVTQYLGSTALVATGIATLPAAPPVGALLIASGGVGLLHRGLANTHGYQWIASLCTHSCPQREKIAQIASFTLGSLSAGLGLAGGGLGLYQGVFALAVGGENFWRQASLVVGFASSCLSHTFQVGHAWVEKETLNLQAKLDQLSEQIRIKEDQLQQVPSALCTEMQLSGWMLENIQNALSAG